MQGLLRFWGTALLLCLTLFFAVSTVAIISNTWFGDSHLTTGQDRVAVIDLKGVIYKSGAFTRKVSRLLEDGKVKALVVRINSPGGLVGPSQEIYESLKRANEKIPVIASIGSLGASGGYYVALGARKIFANPGSLTASIGVISEFANLERLYQWAKIERFALKSGKLKDVGSETRKMTPEEREFLTAMLKDIHDEFKSTVQTQRKLTPEETEKWTDGRVMTGSQAFKAKLIDSLGGMEEAVTEAKKAANLSEKAPVEYPETHKGGILKELLGSDDDDLVAESFLGSIKNFFQSPVGQTRWRILLLAPLAQ
ncbi:MAG: signal peptide peptidase SppA [Proteobacteria bacterium]|nr:signal peptide peptidase SppA [Pseudomonadota bacterium]